MQPNCPTQDRVRQQQPAASSSSSNSVGKQPPQTATSSVHAPYFCFSRMISACRCRLPSSTNSKAPLRPRPRPGARKAPPLQTFVQQQRSQAHAGQLVIGCHSEPSIFSGRQKRATPTDMNVSGSNAARRARVSHHMWQGSVHNSNQQAGKSSRSESCPDTTGQSSELLLPLQDRCRQGCACPCCCLH